MTQSPCHLCSNNKQNLINTIIGLVLMSTQLLKKHKSLLGTMRVLIEMKIIKLNQYEIIKTTNWIYIIMYCYIILLALRSSDGISLFTALLSHHQLIGKCNAE